MSARKTVPVATLRDIVNRILDVTADEMTESRTCAAQIWDEIAIATDNYRGFRFTQEGDETRRSYY